MGRKLKKTAEVLNDNWCIILSINIQIINQAAQN